MKCMRGGCFSEALGSSVYCGQHQTGLGEILKSSVDQTIAGIDESDDDSYDSDGSDDASSDSADE